MIRNTINSLTQSDNCISRDFNLIILNNKQVVSVYRYINYFELKKLIPAEIFNFPQIVSDIDNFQICRLRFRTGLVRIKHYHITGIWDY